MGEGKNEGTLRTFGSSIKQIDGHALGSSVRSAVVSQWNFAVQAHSAGDFHGRATEARPSLCPNGPRCQKAISTTLSVFRSRDRREPVPTASIRSGAEIALTLRSWPERLFPDRRSRKPSSAL